MFPIGPIGRDAYSSALWGMGRAQEQVHRAGWKIAKGDVDSYADSFVELMRGQRYFSANAKVVQVQREMDKSLLDIFV